MSQWKSTWQTVLQTDSGPLIVAHTTEEAALHYAEYWTGIKYGYPICEVREIQERTVATRRRERIVAGAAA